MPVLTNNERKEYWRKQFQQIVERDGDRRVAINGVEKHIRRIEKGREEREKIANNSGALRMKGGSDSIIQSRVESTHNSRETVNKADDEKESRK